MTPLLSVIIPTAPAEADISGLLHSLAALGAGADTGVAAEVIIARPAGSPALAVPACLPLAVRTCATRGGRAACQNDAATVARGRYLWFLHADSVPDARSLPALRRALAAQPAGLLFFDLRFLDDGPFLMKINEWGARVRSRLFGVPFGDQGFCLERELFRRLGGFDEKAAWGEDNLLVWRLRRQGLPLRCVGAALRTSARSYRRLGWLRTTCLYQYRWISQAWASRWTA